MLTEKDKATYNRLADKGIYNHAFYALGKWGFVNWMRHLFIDLEIGTEDEQRLKNMGGRPCIIAAHHSLTICPPLICEVMDNILGKPHALVDQEEYARHSKLYSSLEMVPFSTARDTKLREDREWSLNELRHWLQNVKEPVLIFNDGPTALHEKILKKKEAAARAEGRGLYLPVLSLEDRPNSEIPARLAAETDLPIVVLASYVPERVQGLLYAWDRKNGWKHLFRERRIHYGLGLAGIIYPSTRSVGEVTNEIRVKQIERYNELRKDYLIDARSSKPI